jgi:hypothetical protein|tara:strand:+ start:137 stop:1006 length:870 start_codon:yes stop_codon:yes gene_type:complete
MLEGSDIMGDKEDFEFEKIGGLIGIGHILALPFLWGWIGARFTHDWGTWVREDVIQTDTGNIEIGHYEGGGAYVACWDIPDSIYLGEYCHYAESELGAMVFSAFAAAVAMLALAVITKILRGPSEPKPQPEPEESVYPCDPDEGDIGVCEFHYSPLDAPPDENDGLCPYCGGLEMADMLLLFKAIDDRWIAARSVSDTLDDALHDRLHRVVSATVDHDIDLANSEEGTPDSRVEALKLKAADHRELILEAMASRLDEASYEKLGREMKAHVNRVRAWEPKENWWEGQPE